MRNAHRAAGGDAIAAAELLSSIERQAQPVTDAQAAFATELSTLTEDVPPVPAQPATFLDETV